jgi:hypothetical protein
MFLEVGLAAMGTIAPALLKTCGCSVVSVCGGSPQTIVEEVLNAFENSATCHLFLSVYCGHRGGLAVPLRTSDELQTQSLQYSRRHEH